MKIDARGLYYKDLNDKIRRSVAEGEDRIELENVNGQRYLGTGIKNGSLELDVHGVPGNDLAAFMDGPTINVHTNGQDAIGNTMNAGKVVIHGDAGDVIGHSMRGGKIFVRDNVGYRAGIHMKAYRDLFPVVVVGGTARDFLGEYMAGGLLVVLGLGGNGSEIAGNYIGTGMHGGEIYIRGEVEEYQLGKEVGIKEPTDKDIDKLRVYLSEYAENFDLDVEDILTSDFIKITPETHRPYGKIYAY